MSLQLSDHLFAFPLNHAQLVSGKLSPLHSHSAFHLFPISFNLLPIHFLVSFSGSRAKVKHLHLKKLDAVGLVSIHTILES